MSYMCLYHLLRYVVAVVCRICVYITCCVMSLQWYVVYVFISPVALCRCSGMSYMCLYILIRYVVAVVCRICVYISCCVMSLQWYGVYVFIYRVNLFG